ncbi:hypothetical protein [Kitasatospora sp. NPDC096140]|uniref:hypothetical protein n=1 Tax=unclassified Kitasatospora TaxID=2633591 RepID=UPI0033259886
MRSYMKALGLSAAVIGLTAAMGSTSMANASEKTGTKKLVSEASAPMKVFGFDAAVAEQNGYKIVTLPNGQKASVPKSAPVQQTRTAS